MNLRRTAATLAAAAVLTAAALPAGQAAAHDLPETIDLPAGFAGEGVAVEGDVFYAGSVADGRIARGDLRLGTSEVFVSTPLTPVSVGLKADAQHGLLWVAGGPSGRAAVYDLDDGAAIVDVTLTTGPSFINDVAVTRTAAYFTNSVVPEIYRVPVTKRGVVGEPRTISLRGPAGEYVGGFNLNGIAATTDGDTLIAVNSAKGELYRIDATTGRSTLINLGGRSVPTGDGILLAGDTLYVLQNGTAAGVPNQIAVVKLDPDLSRGRVARTITSPLFETATTLGRSGGVLVAVNAQFAGAPIDPEAELVLVDRNG